MPEESERAGNEARKRFLESMARGTWQREETPAVLHVPFPGDAREGDLLKLAQTFRRALLTRVPGWAVTSMRLEYETVGTDRNPWLGLPQKYGVLPGVVENVREIARNLQGGVFRLPEGMKALAVDADIPVAPDVSDTFKEICLAEWFEEEEADMVRNPEHVVLTLQDTVGRIWIQFMIREGTGFRPAVEATPEGAGGSPEKVASMALEKSPGLPWLPLDADFNPVTRVGLRVEETEKGRALRFSIETRPNRSPRESFAIALDALSRTH